MYTALPCTCNSLSIFNMDFIEKLFARMFYSSRYIDSIIEYFWIKYCMSNVFDYICTKSYNEQFLA